MTIYSRSQSDCPDGGSMGDEIYRPAQETPGLPPVFVEVPDKSGILCAGTSRLLNTGLTTAELRLVCEPAPLLFKTVAERRRSTVMGVTWILACLITGWLLHMYEDSAEAAYTGESDWILAVLAVLIPFALVFSFYPHWQEHRHKKRHRAWLARFIKNWPLRERLVEVERIPDLRQRVIVEDMAATMAEYRNAVQHSSPSPETAVFLMAALTAVGTYARAATDDPALEVMARQALARFCDQTGRRREGPIPPSGPPSSSVQRLRRRNNGSVNDAGR